MGEISWMQDILGPEPVAHKTVAAEFAYKTPYVKMRLNWRGVPYKKEYDTGPALEWDARQTSLWAATLDKVAELCESNRRDIACALGIKGFPSSPYRIRQYW